jgi:hypothetical protein
MSHNAGERNIIYSISIFICDFSKAKNHRDLSQVTVESREEEESHCQKRVQPNDQED